MTDERQRQIIEGVWAVIVEHGVAAVSMRSVASAAGVSVGRVQHHFGTKAELVRASVREMLAAAERANPEAAAATGERATLWGLLAHSLEPAERSRRGVSVFYAYVAAGAGDPWIADQLARAKQGQTQQVAACLVEQFPHLPDPEATAGALVALADGCTQAVYLGYSTSDAAASALRRALESLGRPS